MPKLITSRTRIEDLEKPRIIVVGGGFGGMQVVEGLCDMDAQVVLFDKHNHHTFQPLLYQVATSAIQTQSIIYPFRKKFRDQLDFYFRLAEVIEIKPDENCIETSIGSVKYDVLVLAGGAASNYFGNTDFEKYALPLKTIEDAISLRNRIFRNTELALLTEDPMDMNRYLDYVVVGGGPTGVELAGALAEMKKHIFPFDYKELDFREMDIHLVEGPDRLLNSMSLKSSEKTLSYLHDLGVQVHLNCKILGYDGLTATFDSIEAIPTKSLIWAAGVKGNPVPGLKPKAYAPNGRIKVNKFNQIPSNPNIFVIGDLALMKTKEHPCGLPMVAPVAIEQGKLLGKNIHEYYIGNNMKPFKYENKGAMATIGRNLAVAEIKSAKFYGKLAWLIWLFVHLMPLAIFKSRFTTLISWWRSYLTFDKANRFIIGSNFGPDETRAPTK
jgi:NADH:ubiquinone reductase (H+-translocating)